ncbi:hypothetical protein AQUCO_02600116v1 [Aquilegia coerulea]|uniref:Uncharacterized protein n=1 Tax=Aquilegia coerulea TaxID=218851 RepID=A0A2G5D7E4_AQUCA|nr:hypothetical protein AQUCO_02600116v1 [Aquilegia coerulea]
MLGRSIGPGDGNQCMGRYYEMSFGVHKIRKTNPSPSVMHSFCSHIYTFALPTNHLSLVCITGHLMKLISYKEAIVNEYVPRKIISLSSSPINFY